MRAAALAMMLAMVAGCSSGDTAAPAPATSAPSAVSSVISPAGGTVTGPDGVQVVIPAGALVADTTIGIARNPAGAPLPLQEGNAPAGPVYEFTPHDLVFNVPVTIRMPVPANGVGAEVFMASLGADWQVNNATLVNGFAEWQRNSFSFGMAGLACAIPVGSTDPYPCAYPSGGATVEATAGAAITQIAPGWLNFGSGSAGSWRVTSPGTIRVTLHYRAAPDCSDAGGGAPSGHVKLIRWNPAVPLNTPGRVTTVFDLPVALTQTPVTPPPGTFSHGGGPTFRGEGSTTVDTSSHLGDATNVFGFTFSCQRPGRPVILGGDLITIIGPMAAPGTTYSIGGTVSNLTGSGLVLRNNNGNDLAVPANATSFTFTSPIAAGALYNVTVQTQPSGQTCTVQNGGGTANGPVTNVAVTCAAISGGPLALVANSGSNTLSIYRVDASTGVLSSLGTVPAGSYPYRVAITPNGLYAYVTNLLGGTVSSFGINNITGVLTPIPLSSPGTQNPYGIAMDPSGRFVWVANYGFHTVSAFSIDGSTGVLASAGPTVPAAGFPHSITAHPSGNFVYVGSEQANSISVYGVNPGSGQLTLSSTAAYSVSAPYSIAVHPLLNVAYVTDSNGYVIVLNINPSNGALTFSSNVAVGTSPTSVVVHPNGQYAYVANSGIRVYSINQSTGALTLSGSPVSAGSNPRTIAIDTTGMHLYVTNLGSNNVSAFSIGSGGAVLTSLGAAVGAGSGPEGIALTP
ncbi:MAG: beta-propeller fold lactonase family protein [Nitrospirota bacterium]|nr:beta-propeller fold lactonase family protein [Nitrospirota bacterium]